MSRIDLPAAKHRSITGARPCRGWMSKVVIVSAAADSCLRKISGLLAIDSVVLYTNGRIRVVMSSSESVLAAADNDVV